MALEVLVKQTLVVEVQHPAVRLGLLPVAQAVLASLLFVIHNSTQRQQW
jgi:hypothetical protein